MMAQQQQKHNSNGTGLKWNIVAQGPSSSSASNNDTTTANSAASQRNRSSDSKLESFEKKPASHDVNAGRMPLRASSIDQDSSALGASSGHRPSFSADWRAVGNPTPPAPQSGKPASNKGSPPSLSGLNYSSPIAQLPMSLNKAIGLDDPDEVAEIFRRTSISAPPPQTAPPYIPQSFVPSPRPPPPQSSSAMNRAYSLANIQSYAYQQEQHVARRPSYALDMEPQEYYVEDDYSQPAPHHYYAHARLPPHVMHHPYPVMPQAPYSPRYAQPVHMRRHSAVAHHLPDHHHFAHFDLSSECVPAYDEAEMYGEPYYPPQSAPPMQQHQANRYSTPSPSQSDFIGVDPYSSLQAMPVTDANFQLSSFKGPLYTVEFKADRTELFFILEIDGKPTLDAKAGDFVIVEADRGEDLGKVTSRISLERLKKLLSGLEHGIPKEQIEPEIAAVLANAKEIVPKRIHRKASSNDLKLLQAKAQEEAIAMVRCQSRVRQKKLPMEMIDAEYQWDRNKLTFYFYSEVRIDFRELVRDLFRIYKTRIWMCAVDRSRRKLDLEPHQQLLESEGCLEEDLLFLDDSHTEDDLKEYIDEQR